MAKLCECCGKKSSSLAMGEPLYLTNEKILCRKCAEYIRDDINNLYGVKTTGDFEGMKNNIITKSRECFSDAVTEDIIVLINKIGNRLDLIKDDTTTVSAMYSTTNRGTSAVGSGVGESNSMFSNIGGKIKALAQVLTWIGIIASVISGIALMVVDESIVFVGLMVMVFGSLISWVSSFVLYGFGQLVENSDKLVEMSKK